MKTRQRARQIRELCGPFMRPFYWITLWTLLEQATTLAVAIFASSLVDSVEKKSLAFTVGYLAGIFVCLSLGKVFEWARADCHIGRVITDMESHISKTAFRKISRLSIGQIVNQNSGFSQDVLKKGENAVGELMHTLFMEVIPALIRVVTTLVSIMVFVGFWVGLVALASVVGFTWVSIKVNKSKVPGTRKLREQEGKISQTYWEVIKHFRLVVASDQEERVVREYGDRHGDYGDKFKAHWQGYVAAIASFRDPFAVIGHTLILVMTVRMVWTGQGNSTDLIEAISLSGILFGALSNVGSMQRRLVRNFVLTGKMLELFAIKPAVTDKPGAASLRSFDDGIVFENVSFRYPVEKIAGGDDASAALPEAGQTAVSNVSLTIKKGEVVAFVGPSGSGKSTLVTLLQRGYDPDSGRILVDGKDIRDIALGSWRDLLGIVEQSPKLWDETVGYNITWFHKGDLGTITEDMIHRAARTARVDEFYPRLGLRPLEAQIGEGGVLLSGGQCQRVAIARAIFKNPSVLILDEATNALDPRNESRVHEAIRAALEGRTGIIVAHRLSTIRNADKIVVFDAGRIVGVGTDDELMRSCPSYRELVEHELGIAA